MTYYVVTKATKENTRGYNKFKKKGIQYLSHCENTYAAATKSANSFKRKGISTRIYHESKLPTKLRFN